MTITSFSFLLFLLAGVVIYYVLPKSWQWFELLILSIIFYFLTATPYTIIFMILSTLTAYLVTTIIKSNKVKKSLLLTKVLIIGSITINVLLWLALKGSDLYISISYRISTFVPFVHTLNPLPFVAALGMGYYTLQIIGYILDCYWGTIEPQKNILKLFLFVAFFPQLLTGPISRYEQLQTLYEKHTFSYINITHGAQRILWGFFKKLVLAERVAVIINGIWGNLDGGLGYYYWIALLLYPIQIYADFSGCMDIILGVAECFGIKLPENFNNPFFSRTVQEFWQRWHITLGTWAKDYVLYPLLKSSLFIKLGKKTKKKFGKTIGKLIPTSIGLFCLWMVMGIWHGSFKYVIGVSLWYWVVMMLGMICAPILQKIVRLFGFDTECFSWHLFQSIRTYLIYAIGAIFFRADGIGSALIFIKGMIGAFKNPNPWIFFDGSIYSLGVSSVDLNIIVFAILLLIIVAMLKQKYGYARIWMDKQIIIFRWLIWLIMLVIVIIYGKYGPGYSAAQFIYQGF